MGETKGNEVAKRDQLVDWVADVHAQLPPSVREMFTQEEIRAVIRAKVSAHVTAEDIIYGFILSAQTGLSIVKKELYVTRGKPKDGVPGKLLVMAGIDGLIANAERHGDYQGFRGDVVCENDDFSVEWSKDGDIVHHKWRLKDRGEIVGAWAQVYRKGWPPVFFYASWDEYAPKYVQKGGSWDKNPSAMMRKTPLSWCLRRAYSLSGIVGEDEMAQVLEADAEGTAVEDGVPHLAEVMASVPDDLRTRLRSVLDDAKDIRGGVPDSTVILGVRGQPRDAIAAFIERVEQDNRDANDAQVEAAREAQDRNAEQVHDAEVVEDGPEVIRERLAERER